MRTTQSHSVQKLIFEGDSFFNLKSSTTATTDDLGGQYIPVTSYGELLSGNVSLYSFALSGRTISQIDAAFSTNIQPILKPGDVVVVNALTNELGTNGSSAAVAFGFLQSYAAKVRGAGGIIVVCTMTARDKTGDAADIETRRLDVNTLIRNNSSLFDAICDIGADSRFDSQADCANTTNYQTDKLHLAPDGSTAFKTLTVTTVNPFV